MIIFYDKMLLEVEKRKNILGDCIMIKNCRCIAIISVLILLLLSITVSTAFSQCFQDQYDIDFIFNTLDSALADFLPTWYDYIDEYGQPQPGAWRQVQCQTSPYFSNADNDCNGINDNDHFDMLGAVLNGDMSRVLGNLNANEVQTIRDDFAYNKAVVETLQITIRNVQVKAYGLTGSTTITTGDKDVCVKLGITTLCVSQFVSNFEGVPTLWQLLEQQSPLFKNAMVNLIAGYMTVGESTGIDHLKSVFRVIIYTVLRDVLPNILAELKTDDIEVTIDANGTPVTIKIYGSEIDRTVEEFVGNFNCSKFRCHPELLASTGNLNHDSRNNYDSYVLAGGNRQAWMVNESIQNPPLQITAQPESQSVTSGTPVTFSIEQVGGENNGIPQVYKWEEIKIDDFSTIGSPVYTEDLTISYPLPTTKPRYFTVTICDSLWTRRSSPAKLEVQYTPLVITEQPVGAQNLVPGEDSHTMSVDVRGGNNLPTYQWQKWDGVNWVNLEGKTQKTISFNPIQLSDGGSYRCVVNSGSEQVISQTAEITILNRIRFEQPLQGGGVYIGENFTFVPVIAGEPNGTLHYLWKFNGEVIEGAEDATLTIENAQLENMGYYTCVIYDDVYNITSNSAFLEVAEHMQIIQQPVSGSGILGYDFTFTIGVTGGLGGVHYQWVHDGEHVGTDSSTLFLYPLQETDAGNYWCIVTDAREMLTSEQATLQVFPPFNFDIQPQGALKHTGESHTFEVAISGGYPPYRYQWRKNGVDIPYTEPVLVLENLQPSDSGTYTCFVSDQNAGATSAPAVLQVANWMSFIQHPQSATVYKGTTHTFSVVIDGGLGNVQYRWYKRLAGGININLGVNSPQLLLSNVQTETAGNYFCEVQDNFETITSNIATLTVVDALSFIQNPSDTYLFVGGDLNFQVTTAGGLGTITYQWYKDGVPIGSPSNVLSIPDVTYDSAGEYWCEATDSVKTTASAMAKLVVLRPIPPEGIFVIANPMTGFQVVPPISTGAYGQAFGVLQPVPGSDNYTISLSGTHSVLNPTGMTINKGLPGVNGPVVFDIGNPSNLSFYSEIENSQAAEIAMGLYYFLISSQNYPNGEIRGQLQLMSTQWKLTVFVSGSGTTNPSPGTYPYWDGETVTITATPASGWAFLNWSGDIQTKDANSPTIQLSMTKNRNITANFVEIVPEGEGIIEGTPEGIPEGEGTIEGIPEGEGVIEGTPEGITEGEGIVEGTLEGTTEGITEGEGTIEGEGIVEGEGSSEGEIPTEHSADQNGDNRIQLSELLRVIQLFNSGGYHCAVAPETSEDGYVPGLDGDKSCRPHGSDYYPQDWTISLSELLRLIQFFNSGGYHACPGESEDNYCVGLIK